MLVVGLTGGLGSGKSTVATLFAKHHVPIIDADQVSRDVTLPHRPAFLQIIEHFGNEVLLKDGTLNRSKLRRIIFTSPKERLWLEDLLHPLIGKEMERQIKSLQAPYCIAVIPLLLEVEFYSLINRILVVDASPQSQIERVMERDHLLKSQIEAILKTQASRDDRIARAHDVIQNDGKLVDLIPQVEKLHEKYLDLSQSM